MTETSDPGSSPPIALDTIGADARTALSAYLYAVGDDETLMGHRASEWTGLGPILEEDIAFSSIAQDELGHALVWYRLLSELGGPDPDTIGFTREPADWRNAVMAELPRGDYANSLMRHYLFDLSEAVRYDALRASTWQPMAGAATKLRQEEKYHLIHGRAYIQRLGRATRESRRRMQSALDSLLPYALGLWEPPPGEDDLVALGIVAPSDTLARTWLNALAPFLLDSGLNPAAVERDSGWQPTVEPVLGGRRGKHGDDLVTLLEAMQGMYRSDPNAAW